MQVCLVCHKRAYSDYCFAHRPRKPIQVKSVPKPAPRPCKWCGKANLHLEFQCPLLPKTPIKKVAKQRGKWQQTRRAWLDIHSFPLHICHYCGITVPTSEMTLDHKIPRSRAPELRYDFGNLVPACWTCNGLKGSVDHDHYPHECHI